MRAALRSARRAPVLSLVMLLSLTSAVAFWMLAEAAHGVETRHLSVLRPTLHRVLMVRPPVALPDDLGGAWLPAHFGELLVSTDFAEAVRAAAPDRVVATFDGPMPVRFAGE